MKFKTLWDWLELLLIPAAVAGIGLYIEKSEIKADREIAKDKQLENALQSYFDSMSHLIINNGLKTSQKDDEIREIAQVKTMTTFERMDVETKAKILMFLSGTKLITTIGKEQIPIISLDSIISIKRGKRKETETY